MRHDEALASSCFTPDPRFRAGKKREQEGREVCLVLNPSLATALYALRTAYYYYFLKFNLIFFIFVLYFIFLPSVP